MKPKLSREQVEQIIETARREGKRADLRYVDLYEANLTGLDFGGADLSQSDLGRADLSKTSLSQATLNTANLFEANLRQANLQAATLIEANLHGVNLREARLIQTNLMRANLFEANFTQANLSQANLEGADLTGAYLNWANFSGVNLKRATLAQASLKGTNLNQADLDDVDLSRATLTGTNLTGANLNCCTIYGMSARDLNLNRAKQLNLVVSPPDTPVITIDYLEIAQFIEIYLNSQRIRDVVDMNGQQIILILGHFFDERQTLLNDIQEALRDRAYLPLFFDGEMTDGFDLTETLFLLARLARFILIDLTDAPNISRYLEQVAPKLFTVPIQPLLSQAGRADSVIQVYQERFPWILPTYSYGTKYDLLLAFDQLLTPVTTKAQNLADRRRVAAEVEARRKG